VARIEQSIVIDAPKERIWAMLLWDQIPEWLGIITAAEYTSAMRKGVGATAHVVGETASIRSEWDVEITEYVENERAAWRTTSGDLTAIGLTTLQPTDTGVKVTFVIDYALPYSILGKVIDKLVVSRDARKGIADGLTTLKAQLSE
jgi:uncharacterized membrane protein